MEDMMETYKVARMLTGGGYESAIVYDMAAVRYRIGKRSSPPPFLERAGYWLLSFKTLAHARQFALREGKFHSDRMVILRCKAEGTVKELPNQLDIGTLAIGEIPENEYEPFPMGSVMSKHLTPICVVQII